VAVSVPAQCIRPNGSRSSDPYLVRIPGDQCAIEQLVLTGPENNEEGEHAHQVSIE